MAKLREIINSRQVSVRELALEIGVSEQYLSSVCCGKKKLSPKRFKQINDFLELTKEEYNEILKEYVGDYLSKFRED